MMILLLTTLSLVKYSRKSMRFSQIHFSNVGVLGVPYWLSCPIERVFNSGRDLRRSIEHVRNFSVLPGRCDVRVNVEIPKGTVLATPGVKQEDLLLRFLCLRKVTHLKRRLVLLSNGLMSWITLPLQILNLKAWNLVMRLMLNLQTKVSKTRGRFILTVLSMLALVLVRLSSCFRSSLFEAKPSIKFRRSSEFAKFTES
ncbi:uncharacterized protein LOC110023434 isoform X3 [Phalaenopsis equestris]|uniref:uncharacterized protein LOC110023434 isoform X3 n=1 Tax=Phalaenopsis equestris TaxID=78828 RepID=UPI0009E42825|nr:uncharacterized protein LOC110023434 isoform X3 [Phalaenopsis equestris]